MHEIQFEVSNPVSQSQPTSMETQDSPPLDPSLDPSLTPVLLFGSDHGGAEAGDAAGTSRLLYSIPKRQLLPVPAGWFFGYLNSDLHWITPQGWVLVVDPTTRDASLRDPFTSRTVRLPRDQEGLLPASTEKTRCLLSTRRPADNDDDDDPACCRVVLVIHLERPVLWYCTIVPRGSSWLAHEYPLQLFASHHGMAMVAVRMLTAARGKFYTSFMEEDKLVTLEFSPAGPVFSATRAVPTPWLPLGYRLVIVESCADLFAVRFNLELVRGQRIVDIYVYRLVSSENTWVKVAELGDGRVFFVNGVVGASMAADEIFLKANCVYFTDDDDKGLYVYDMEQGSITLHNPGPEVPDSSEPMLLMHAI